MKRIIEIVFFLQLIFFCQILKAEILFYREDIDFTIDQDTFIVNGDYFFQNNQDRTVKSLLEYPFPQDSLMSEVFDVSVEVNGKNQIKKNDQNRLIFNLEILGLDSLICQISYKQIMNGNAARYILKTTRYWDKPLNIVNYRLQISREVEIQYFSYYPDSFEIDENNQYYYWKKSNFYPDKDFIIRLDK